MESLVTKSYIRSLKVKKKLEDLLKANFYLQSNEITKKNKQLPAKLIE